LQVIESSAFDHSGKRILPNLTDTKKVKQIYLDAHTCKVYALALLLKRYRRWPTVLQQAIPDHTLSMGPSPLPANPDKLALVERKTGFVFSYSHLPSTIALRTTNNTEQGHTTDSFTKRTVTAQSRLFKNIILLPRRIVEENTDEANQSPYSHFETIAPPPGGSLDYTAIEGLALPLRRTRRTNYRRVPDYEE
jgi:hypothetical protein